MKTSNVASPAAPVILSAVLDDPIGAALDRAAGDCLMSRAGLARRLIAEGLRREGYLPALPTPKHSREAVQ